MVQKHEVDLLEALLMVSAASAIENRVTDTVFARKDNPKMHLSLSTRI